MADFKDPLLLPIKHPNLNPNRLDFLHVKKRGQGLRSWIRVDAESGASTHVEVDKFTMMRRLPARDLRLLDPLFVYPSTILGRERAIVVNLEQICCVITANEVLLLNSAEGFVIDKCVRELQRMLILSGCGGGRGRVVALEAADSPDYSPFRVLGA